MVNFDWTIDVDMLAQGLVLLGAVVRAHIANRERLVKIETRLDYIESAVKPRPRA